jgi:hypothetical protein
MRLAAAVVVLAAPPLDGTVCVDPTKPSTRCSFVSLVAGAGTGERLRGDTAVDALGDTLLLGATATGAIAVLPSAAPAVLPLVAMPDVVAAAGDAFVTSAVS